MPHNRFFVDQPLIRGETIDLKEEARHLKVMRIREGETIEIVNGRHQLGFATVQGKGATLTAVEERPAPKALILCQAIPRMNRLDTIVEKGTELGMTELWLFPAERSEKKSLSKNQLERVAQITIAALKQCGRLDLPKIVVKPPLLEWESAPLPAFYGDTGTQAPQMTGGGKACFIGPEAGFSSKEEAHLMTIGVSGAKLHNHILRTDTAALVAVYSLSMIE